MAPNRPTLLSRSISIRTIRIAFLFGLIAVTASVLSSTSLAGTISQKFFTRAVALVTGEKVAPASHTLAAEEAVAAPVESTTMLVERRGHTATRLADGRVLIAGGENGSGTLNETEIYDPASGTFSAAANMASARADHSATLLADGRVLIAGGHNGGTSLTSTELFDPSSGAFTNGPSMSVARAGHSATLLANGRVFVAGGDAAGSAEIFDANAGTFTAAASLGAARSMHSAALLQDGRVLIVGGRDGNGDPLFTGEIFDTPAGTFSNVGSELKAERVHAHLRLLFDGKVQIIGGNNDGSMELYDPLYEGFGGYAHVLPEGDTCAGLSGQIQITQTRAALFHNGQTDPLFDRSGHTITELNGKALVLGGANSSGAVLNSSAVLVSSGASVSTDKMDYAPGETAHITGRGFQPGEVVRLKIHEDPHTPQERGFDATADADGNFSGDYLVTEYDLDMKFIVGARGLTSGATAQTTMTDSNNFSVTPASQTVAAGSTNTFVWTFTANNSANIATTTFTIPAGWTAPRTGPGAGRITITAGTCAASLNGVSGQVVTINQPAGGCNSGTTFTLTYANATAPIPAITTIYTFANQHGTSPTVTVTAVNVNTTTTVANATATYGDTSVTLNATVTPAVNSGSVTFTVKQGATTIGAATTDNTVVAGAASVSYSLPAGTNAGAYTIEASYTPGAGLNASSGTGSLTINKRAATWTTNAASKTYGDADPSPLTTGSGTNFVAADNVTATYSRAAGENASPPTYHITATLSATPAAALNNYTITNNGAEFTINKRAATWTTNAASKTYGDADPSPLTTGSGTNFVAADNVTATYSRAAGENASPPTYHITATLSATPASALDNYIITNNGAEFTINKRLATWTTNAASKTYGDADPSPLTTGSGSNFVAADNVTATYSRAAGENASPPTYHITATLSATPAAALNNYIITNDGAEFTINKRPATWTTNAASKTYGDADPSPLTTGSGSNFVAADNVTATYSRAAGENASPPTYHITATLSATPAAALNNYIITNNGAEFTINKRLATWTTNAASKTYGDADPSPLTTGSGTNFVAADNVTATYSRAAGENASPPTYHITATLSATPASALDNYIVTNTGAEFTINKRPATWTTNAASKTYGDADPSPLTTGSGTNFVAADNVTATYSRAAGENASPPTYHITATLGATPASALDNYIITNAGAEFTINKRPATWTTNAASKTYGDADPSPLTTGSGSNFVAADNVTATYSRAAGENASPPTYHITATLSATPAAALDNYIVTNTGAEFTINKRLATWTTNAASKTYGDADPSPLTTGSGTNFVAADNVTATYSRAAGENASPPTYHITATLSATPAAALDNYIITNNGAEFTINKRPATWTTNPASKTYGDADPSPLTTGSGTNFVAADNVTATYFRTAGENASPPTYHITATLSATPLSALDNYIITNNGAEFTINKRVATWTTNPASKTYGDADPSPLTTGSGSNFVAADNVTATYFRTAGENASPPTYHITAALNATPLSALDNYIITNEGAEFTINKRLATWATNPNSKTYGDADPSPLTTGSGTNFVAADNVTATYSRAAGENASPPAYHITATLSATPLSALDNYIITNGGAEFSINKRLATWTTNPNSKTYGDVDPSPITTGSGTNFVAADNVTATYSRVAGESASPPTYHITATLSATPLSALDNYIITNDGAEFTINKRLATWTTNPNSKTYGDVDPSPITTGSGTNFVAADNVTASYSRVAGENASPPTYHITATLSATPLSALDNYIITNNGAEFSINKRLATWTTNPASKTYGDTDPSPLTTGSGTNFVAADNVTASYSRVAGENASPPTYHITATLSATPASALDNYIITNAGAEFTINKRAATWTTNAASKTYGNADPSPLTTGSGTNFVAADNVTATYSRVAGENASPPTYHITATLSATPASALDNYIITNDGAEFTINKRLATWTTNPASKTYGNADPSPLTTGSGSNFVAADNVTATYSRVAGENASPPTYHITATLSATPISALDNYTITNNGAEFTINKRPIQVTANAGQFKTYGDSDPTFTYTLTTGTLAFTDTFTGALSRVAGENVGLYALTVGSLHVNDGNGGNNYNLTFVSKNFEIKKRLITVKADPKTKTFGSPDPVFTYQITSGSLALSNTFTGALTRDPGELVGQYTIKIGTLAINDGNGGNNYTLTFVEDKLTIVTACSVFNGFLSPIGGAVEFGNGGTFNDPVRAFKLNSTIPVKFTAVCSGVPLTTGVHTLQVTKYSTAVDGDAPIDATPTDAATDGNQFRLTGTEWHFNMNTKALGGNAQGTYLLKATLFDGSSYSVWVSIKK